MFRNYLKVLFRNLSRRSGYALINILGLSLGITGAIIIYSIIDFELSYDRHHDDLDRIYRILTRKDKFGTITHSAGVPFQIPGAIREQFESVEHVVTVNFNWDDPVFINPETNDFFVETHAVYVDEDYFDIFSYQWLRGDPTTALKSEESIVIAREVAEKFFGEIDVLDQTLIMNDSIEWTIGGVIENPPINSNLPFNVFCVFGEKARREYQHWSWASTSDAVQCFVKVGDGADVAALGDQITQIFNQNVEERAEGIADHFSLQPMKDVHFDDRVDYSYGPTFSVKGLIALGMIGVFLVITACVNFINLNTVLASKRSKEIGIRKTMGAGSKQIATALLLETSVLVLISILISFGIGEIAFMYIEVLVGHPMDLNLLSNVELWIFSAMLFVGVTILAGLYPAWLSSAFQPAETLKPQSRPSGSSKLGLRKTLVIVQFVISQALIVGTIVVVKQMDYFYTRPLGFESEAIVEIPIPDGFESYSNLKSEWRDIQGIENISFSNTGAINSNTWFGSFDLKYQDELLQEYAHAKFIDKDYFDTYRMEFLSGELRTDTSLTIYVNEKLLNEVGITNVEEALEHGITLWGYEGRLGGVIGNHNTESLHKEISPVIYIPAEAYTLAAIRMSTSNYVDVLPQIENIWKTYFPRNVFSYQFLDDRIAAFYEEEKRTSNLLQVFSVTAIIIGIIGLLGLVSFVTEQKTKEIGIRKALGASVQQILGIFFREFSLLILVAFIIAIPVSYYFMQQWLNEFNYRITMDFKIFLIAFVISALIALITVGYRSLKAALVNPVDSLRNE